MDDENASLKLALVMLIDDTDMSVLVSDKSRIGTCVFVMRYNERQRNPGRVFGNHVC